MSLHPIVHVMAAALLACCAPPAAQVAPTSPTPALRLSPPLASAAPAPAAPPWPDAVPRDTPAPEDATALGTASDGRVLLRITSSHMEKYSEAELLQRSAKPGARPNPDAVVRKRVTYYGVYNPATLCIDEIHTFDAFDKAGFEARLASKATALTARFDAEPVTSDLARLRALAMRFGLRTLGDVAFSADEGSYVVAIDPFLAATRDGHLVQLDVGAAYAPAASPDGRLVAFTACGTPCTGNYHVDLLDTKTHKVRRTEAGGVGSEAGFRWSPAGDLLLFAFTQAHSDCVAALDPKTLKSKTLACQPGVGSFAASPGLAMFVLGSVPLAIANDAHVVYGLVAKDGALPTAIEMYRTPGDAGHPVVDDMGRVAWEAEDGPGNRFRVHLAAPEGAEVVDDARLVGVLPDGAILLWPDDHPSSWRAEARPMTNEDRCRLIGRHAPR